MTTTRSERSSRRRQPTQLAPPLSCPACGVYLDAGATPQDSVVLCARCCTPLLWDGQFTLLTQEQIAALPEADRVTLQQMMARQRRRLCRGRGAVH